MSIYKLERCRACHYKRREPKPGKNGECCGQKMYYSKNWYFSYYLHGKKYEQAAGPDKKAAQEAEWKKKISVTEGRAYTPTSWQIGVEELESTYPKLSPKTVEMYRNCVAKLSISFSSMRLSSLTGKHLTSYKEKRLKQGASSSSFNRERATLKRIFSLCGLEWRFKKSIFTSEHEEPRDRFLDENEKAILMDACKKHELLFTAILTALDTGLRKTSLLTLQWKDINFKDNLITKAGKGGKVHRVPMTGRLRDHLIEYRTRQKVLSMWVFPGSDIGKPITDIRKSFSSACREAGVPDIRFHDLRRSFATSVLAATGDLTLVQSLLGHSDINVTRRIYAHTLESRLHDGMKEFEQYSEAK